MEDKERAVYEKFRYACDEGNFETVLQLIESGECSPSRLLKGGYSCLHYAAAYGNLDVVRTLIETYRCNPNSKYGGGCTSLHIACYYGHIDVVRYLVSEQNCSPYKANKKGFSPLHYAVNAHIHYVPLLSKQSHEATCDHYEIVKFLVLECPCELSRQKLKALSHILYLACRYGVLEDIKCFIEKGLKLHECIANLKPKKCDTYTLVYIRGFNRNPKTYNNLVHAACMNGRLEVVKYLIEDEQCDPRECNSDGDSAIHVACRNGNLEVLKYLLEDQKLEPNVENRHGELPLHLACENQSLHIVKFVSAFTQPQDVEAKTSPVHIACSNGSFEAVKHLVKERRWNPKCEDSSGLTPLHHACGFQGSYRHGRQGQLKRKVNLELVLFLVKECGCNPMKTTDRLYHSDEHRPIGLACKECDLELVKVLISSDVNCRDRHGNGPLHLACKYEAMKILRYLIVEAKCDPTIQNSKGELPLHVACEQKSLEMVKLVSNCSVDSRTTDGDTPLHIACKLGTLDIVRYLIHTKGCSPSQNREIYNTLNIHAVCESEDMALIRSIATPENVNSHQPYCVTIGELENDLLDDYTFRNGTPLHIACKTGQLEQVQFLVQEMNASVNVVDGYKKLPLHFACRHDLLELVQLVSGCEDVNSKDSLGDTPLHVACKNEALKIVQFLIREKLCDPTLQNEKGQLCLHIACQKQSLKMALLVSDCDPNCTMNYFFDRETPLHIACRCGDFDIAKYLIVERKCDPAIRNYKNKLPIHYACMHSLEMVKLIVDACQHSVVSTTTDKGATPLHFACLYGKLEIVRFLTEEMAANPSVPDKNGLTPLHYACGICSYSNTDSSENENISAIAKYMVTRHECNPLETRTPSNMGIPTIHLWKRL